MATKDGAQKLNKLFETGISVAKIAQARAEEVLKDAAHISEMQRNQMKDLFEETARKSKQNTEVLIKSLRKEMEKQIRSANLISREEVVKLSDKVSALTRELGKVSILKDEIAKLNEILGSLLKTDSKSDPETKSESGNDTSSSGEDSVGGTSDQSKKPPNSRTANSRTANSRTASSRTTRASSTNTASTSAPRKTSKPSTGQRSRTTKSPAASKSEDTSKTEPKPTSSE